MEIKKFSDFEVRFWLNFFVIEEEEEYVLNFFF